VPRRVLCPSSSLWNPVMRIALMVQWWEQAVPSIRSVLPQSFLRMMEASSLVLASCSIRSYNQ
jgi:hypothetical protein